MFSSFVSRDPGLPWNLHSRVRVSEHISMATDRAVETNTTYYYSTKPPPPRKPHQDSCQMSLAASVSASAYAAMCSRVLDMKIAEVQSFLDDDPECAPLLQRKLEQLIQQRRDRDESLQMVSYKLVLGCLLHV